jgi:hypothetical protein
MLANGSCQTHTGPVVLPHPRSRDWPRGWDGGAPVMMESSGGVRRKFHWISYPPSVYFPALTLLSIPGPPWISHCGSHVGNCRPIPYLWQGLQEEHLPSPSASCPSWAAEGPSWSHWWQSPLSCRKQRTRLKPKSCCKTERERNW